MSVQGESDQPADDTHRAPVISLPPDPVSIRDRYGQSPGNIRGSFLDLEFNVRLTIYRLTYEGMVILPKPLTYWTRRPRPERVTVRTQSFDGLRFNGRSLTLAGSFRYDFAECETKRFQGVELPVVCTSSPSIAGSYLPTGAGLLFTCHQVHAEFSFTFYRRTIFALSSPGAVNALVQGSRKIESCATYDQLLYNTMRAKRESAANRTGDADTALWPVRRTKPSLPIPHDSLIYVRHFYLEMPTYGETHRMEDRVWKFRYYAAWNKSCKNIVANLTALEGLTVRIQVPRDAPFRLTLDLPWVEALLQFSALATLKTVHITLSAVEVYGIDKWTLKAFAEVLRRKILRVEHEIAIRAIRPVRWQYLTLMGSRGMTEKAKMHWTFLEDWLNTTEARIRKVANDKERAREQALWRAARLKDIAIRQAAIRNCEAALAAAKETEEAEARLTARKEFLWEVATRKIVGTEEILREWSARRLNKGIIRDRSAGEERIARRFDALLEGASGCSRNRRVDQDTPAKELASESVSEGIPRKQIADEDIIVKEYAADDLAKGATCNQMADEDIAVKEHVADDLFKMISVKDAASKDTVADDTAQEPRRTRAPDSKCFYHKQCNHLNSECRRQFKALNPANSVPFSSGVAPYSDGVALHSNGVAPHSDGVAPNIVHAQRSASPLIPGLDDPPRRTMPFVKGLSSTDRCYRHDGCYRTNAECMALEQQMRRPPPSLL